MSATPVMPEAQERVVIAVDPHTASGTALAITADLSAVGALRVPANQDGYRRLQRLAARWPQGSWAIENAAAPGAPLTERLRADGIEVPAKLAHRIHLLSAGHGRKRQGRRAVSRPLAEHRGGRAKPSPLRER